MSLYSLENYAHVEFIVPKAINIKRPVKSLPVKSLVPLDSSDFILV